MAKWIEKQRQTTPLGAVVENSLDSGSVINAPSIKVVKDIDTRVQALENNGGGGGGVVGDTLPIESQVYFDGTEDEIPEGYVKVDPPFSNPNLLINGDFQIWQRGTVHTLAKDDKFHYHADRWCTYSTAVTISYTNSNDSTGNGLNVNGSCYISQILETNLEIGRKYTVSLQINKSIIVTQVITGGTYGDYGRISYLQHNDGKCYIRIKLSNETLNWVKLEVGSIATPFSPRPYAEEYAMCQRYYIYLNNIIGTRLQTLSDIACEIRAQFPVPMRDTPTLYDVGVGMYKAQGTGQGASTIEIKSATNQSVQMYVYFPNVLFTGTNGAWIWGRADAEIY